jgi:flagellar hook-basal body complex protein FliE
MSGDATDMHTAILAVQKADVSFQMMMAVRSKLVDAYRAVMQMQM